VTLARTDPRGVAHVVSLLARDSAVTAHAAGFAPANKLGAEIARAGSTCTLELQRGLHARVRVVDSGGVPMGGVRVRHGEGGRDPGGVRLERDRGLDDVDLRREETRVTDRDGACTFADLGRGTHTFALERDRALFDGEWAIQDVVADDTTTVTLVTRGLGEILGRVTDGKLAIPGARVALFRAELAPTRDPYVEADGPLPAGMDTAADSRGRFRFQNVDPGAYELAFAVPGQSLRVARVIAVDVGARNVAVDVARDAVDGEVRRADGAPASGAAIWVVPRDRDARADALRRRISNGDDVFGLELDMRGFPSDSEHPAMFADAAGRFRLCGLAHNVAFTLYASDGQNSAGARALSASRRPRDEHDVAIQLEARGAIRASIGATPWRSPLALVATHPSALPRVARVHGGLALALPALEPGTWELTLREERAGGRWIPIGDRHELEIRAGASETLDIPYP